MNQIDNPATPPEDQELVITRVFDAPPDLVFKAWTEPERLRRWWGPKGFTLPFCTVDLRPGGAVHFCMRSPEGHDIWCKGIYQEIVEPERIVEIGFFSDAEGNRVSPTHYGFSPDWPEETLFTMTFEEQDGKTRLTLRQSGVPMVPEREGATVGWNQSFDRLSEFVASEAGERQ
jgi:uncharacterized protein YndB with AHSA1/START domain